MALHRLAASEIKRFDRPDVGLAILTRLDAEVMERRDSNVFSSGDATALLSVTANLRALGDLVLDDADEARAEIVRSNRLHSLEGLDVLVDREVARYGSQVKINLAQVLAHDGQTSSAVSTLRENLKYCLQDNPEYVSEALSALSYGQFRAGQFAASARTAAWAAVRISFEASPTRLRTAREIMVGCFEKMGEHKNALAVLESSDRDPLGLELSFPRRPGEEHE